MQMYKTKRKPNYNVMCKLYGDLYVDGKEAFIVDDDLPSPNPLLDNPVLDEDEVHYPIIEMNLKTQDNLRDERNSTAMGA